MAWKVDCTLPKGHSTYPPGYFPRKYHYKSEAKQTALELIKHGATNITITNTANGGAVQYRRQIGWRTYD